MLSVGLLFSCNDNQGKNGILGGVGERKQTVTRMMTIKKAPKMMITIPGMMMTEVVVGLQLTRIIGCGFARTEGFPVKFVPAY